MPLLTTTGILSVYSCCIVCKMRVLHFAYCACSNKPYFINNNISSLHCPAFLCYFQYKIKRNDWKGTCMFTHHRCSSQKNWIYIIKITGLSLRCCHLRVIRLAPHFLSLAERADSTGKLRCTLSWLYLRYLHVTQCKKLPLQSEI